jgi:hypothetical protein
MRLTLHASDGVYEFCDDGKSVQIRRDGRLLRPLPEPEPEPEPEPFTYPNLYACHSDNCAREEPYTCDIEADAVWCHLCAFRKSDHASER